MEEFDLYKPRQIAYSGITRINDWVIKVYTITLHELFRSSQVYASIMNSLEEMLAKAFSSTLPTHRHAFLIVHEAREGVWVLLSWWTGGEMLETKVQFVSFDAPTLLKSTPHDGHLICVWELEIVQHERAAWIKHVLMNANEPQFLDYQNDILQ
ncbi:MAG: hypothetical protein AAF789_00120 [Bacteroidota bacterium]